MLRASLVLFTVGCGARVGLPVDERSDTSVADAAVIDAPVDTSRLDVGRSDSAPPPPPPPPSCIAELGHGELRGNVPGFDIDFPFVVAGVETFGSHSCPRLFIRAGDSPTFDGAFLEIEVSYFAEDGFEPGPREASLTVFPEGRRTPEPWFEQILVDVLRADGLDGSPTPPETWRAFAIVDYHDATTDLVGTVEDAPYCTDFAICI